MNANAPLTFRVSEKGAVSVYGLQRFPVTLYADQWKTLLAHSSKITQFIEENKELMKAKNTATTATI